MPPRKATSTAGKKGGRTKKAAGLAQPTLGFQSQRPGSANTAKPYSQHRTSSNADIAADRAEDGIEILDSTRPKAGSISKRQPASKKAALESQDDKLEGNRLNVKSKEWAGVLRDAKAAMGNMEPIHAGPDTHDDIHHILRVFDMSTQYGPCIGISRLQRWERANNWGLNPPEEIRKILSTQEGQDKVSYRENVLHSWL